MTASDLHHCNFCHRSVEKPCLSRASSDSCGQSISKTRAGGAGARTISHETPHFVSFHTVFAQVHSQWEEMKKAGRDPLESFSRNNQIRLIGQEAERRYIEWQKAARKNRAWYEVLKIPHKGSKHEILVVRKFRDPLKVLPYIEKRTKKSRGAASFQVQTRQGVVPIQPKQLFGFDPNQKESIMAKAKAKAKAGNGAKAPKVKKDKAYYLKNVGTAKTSGDFIRGMLLKGGKSAGEIAEMTKKKFKGHTTKPSDVYWNRGQLKAAGIKVPDMEKAEK